MPLRAVMDTNVLYAALCSQSGASFALFDSFLHGGWTALISNHLVHEYEELLTTRAKELGLSLDDVDVVLDNICATAEEWQLRPGWHPMLSDPDDEPLVQLAGESAANCIITHNTRHLAPAVDLGIEVLKPRAFLTRLRAA